MHSTVQSQPFRPGTQSTYQPKVAFPYVQAPGPGSPPPPLLLAVWMDDWNAIHGIIEDAKEQTREWWTKLQIPLKPDFVPGGGTSASISGTGQIGGVGTQHDWQTGTIGRSQWDVGSGKLKGHDIQQSGPDSAYTFIATSGGGVHRVGNEWSPLWQVVNERGPNKETAFHLAARLGRHEIALYVRKKLQYAQILVSSNGCLSIQNVLWFENQNFIEFDFLHCSCCNMALKCASVTEVAGLVCILHCRTSRRIHP